MKYPLIPGRKNKANVNLGNLPARERSPATADTARKSLRDHLTAVAPVFVQKAHFMTDDYSLADCYLAPLLWRLPYYRISLPRQARPLMQYAERLFEREAFQASLSDAEREMGEG